MSGWAEVRKPAFIITTVVAAIGALFPVVSWLSENQLNDAPVDPSPIIAPPDRLSNCIQELAITSNGASKPACDGRLTLSAVIQRNGGQIRLTSSELDKTVTIGRAQTEDIGGGCRATFLGVTSPAIQSATSAKVEVNCSED